MQRLRITFSRGDEVKYLSHLDMMRLWERALRRANIPLAYSQGFSPHPRISIAAPLPIGVTGDGELMDIMLQKRMSPNVVIKALGEQLPCGIGVHGVAQVPLTLPSLQSQVRQAEYRVEMTTGSSQPAVTNRACLRGRTTLALTLRATPRRGWPAH